MYTYLIVRFLKSWNKTREKNMRITNPFLRWEYESQFTFHETVPINDKNKFSFRNNINVTNIHFLHNRNFFKLFSHNSKIR